MRRKKTRSIVIIGRRWFDKVNGNTYFSAVTYVNGELVTTIEREYGYDDMYLQRSYEILVKHKYLRPNGNGDFGFNEPLWQYCRDNNISLITHVSDVGRKKDL